MKGNYDYPIEVEWTTDELVQVMQLYQSVELAYERGIERENFLEAYRKFKKVIPMKSLEKQLGKRFEEVSGYSIYQAVKQAKEGKAKILKVKG